MTTTTTTTTPSFRLTDAIRKAIAVAVMRRLPAEHTLTYHETRKRAEVQGLLDEFARATMPPDMAGYWTDPATRNVFVTNWLWVEDTGQSWIIPPNPRWLDSTAYDKCTAHLRLGIEEAWRRYCAGSAPYNAANLSLSKVLYSAKTSAMLLAAMPELELIVQACAPARASKATASKENQISMDEGAKATAVLMALDATLP